MANRTQRGMGKPNLSPTAGSALPSISQSKLSRQDPNSTGQELDQNGTARQVRFQAAEESGPPPPASPPSPSARVGNRGIITTGGAQRLLPLGRVAKQSLFAFNSDDISDFEMASRTRTVEETAKESSKSATGTIQRLDTEELPEINTSAEAIAFFAKHGQNTSIKFVHLVREADSDYKCFDPYALEVVSRQDLNASGCEHWTMSLSGLVHVNPPRPSNFIPLAEWIRKSTLFHVLRCIHYFKCYSGVKLFRIWFHNVKYRTYLNQRSKLFKHLYLARPSFAPTLLDVCSQCKKMEETQLLIKPKIYELQEFSKKSDERRQLALSEFETQVCTHLQRSIDRVAEDLTHRSQMPDENMLDEESTSGATSIHGTEKSKSMYQIRIEKAARLSAVHKAEAELLMMDDYIRLIDMMVVDTLVMHTVHTMQKFLETLTDMYELMLRNKSLFEVSIQFGENGSSFFLPNLGNVQDAVEKMVDDIVQNVAHVTRVLQLGSLKVHFHGVKVQPPSVGHLIKSNTVFSATKNQMQVVLSQNYGVIEDYATMFEEYREIFDAQFIWSIDEFAAKKPKFVAFRTRMNEISAWIQRIETMQKLDFKGIFKVKTDGLSLELQKVSDDIMDDLKGLLLKNFRSNCINYSDELHTKVAVLNKAPEGLQHFVEYVSAIAEMEAGKTRLEHTNLEVQELYEMLIKFDVKIGPDIEVEKDNMLSEVKAFATGLISANERVVEHGNANKEKLEKRIEENNHALDRCIQDLEDSVYNQPSVKPSAEVLEDLYEMEKHMKALEEKCVMFEDYTKKLDQDRIRQEAQVAAAKKAAEAAAAGLDADDAAPAAADADEQKTAEVVEEEEEPQEEENREFFTHLDSARDKFEERMNVWTLFDEWNTSNTEWLKGTKFVELDCAKMEGDAAIMLKRCQDMQRKNKKAEISDDVVDHLYDLMFDFKKLMPLSIELGQDSMKSCKPWIQIFTIFQRQHEFQMDDELPEFHLEELWRWGVFDEDKKEKIADICAIAGGEYALSSTLDMIETGWENAEFIVADYRDGGDLFILGSVDEVSVQLEDNQVTLQTILGSRFVGGIKAKVDIWDTKLRLLSDILEEWILCQRAWLYLENIFCADDIKKQLPMEAAKFAKVDSAWKKHMRKMKEAPSAIGVTDMPGVLEMFKNANIVLDEVQKSLEAYLETKRASFARFYFLSNDELLQILSETRNPLSVQPHMNKCFDSIKSLIFGEEDTSVEKSEEDMLEEEDDDDAKPLAIEGMISGEGEKVSFPRIQYTEGSVEFWLTAVEVEMKKSLWTHTKNCLTTYEEDKRATWFFESPAMSIIAIEQVYWTANCETALNKIQSGEDENAMKDHLTFSNDQLNDMVQLVLGQLTKLQRKCMGALIVIDVHARTVVQDMIDAKCQGCNFFEWSKQLRYYWEEHIDDGAMGADSDDCALRQTNTRFVYGYEYLGNSPRLVITPLTDKCYMTLTGALHVKLGGAPQGPAGTGKTETTKDLAKALARNCVVFNCSDGLDYLIMGRFFSGLVQCGAWACFDEFNRIDIEVLSVIAQMMLSIIYALNDEVDTFLFEGRMIPLNPSIGVFITMNPGYAGRTELPDNLKALFRPVAMMVPDYGLIAEIILFSEGFMTATLLSGKMVKLYSLSSEQLSKQDHYDFGMRAVKSVLVMAGQLKRTESHLTEEIVLIRAMRDSNLPKFLFQDVPLFLAIIQDLFPGVVIPFVDYGNLQVAIEAELVAQELQKEELLIGKIIQYFEITLVRHGVMIVGWTGVGKTTNWFTLQSALTSLNESGQDEDGKYLKVICEKLNPKAITMGQMYGETNPVSGEWTDGLVPTIVRAFITNTSIDKKWIVFDGPVDAIWIENMNTVLDDNKMLCLTSGERIKLPETMTVLFEVNDLAVASPATVSRCGMVYMEPVHLPWQAVVKTWTMQFNKKYPGQGDPLYEHIVSIVDPTLPMMRKKLKEGYPYLEIMLVQGLLRLLSTNLTEAMGVKADHPAISTLIKINLIFCFVWSIGGNLHEDSHAQWEEFVRPLLKKISGDIPDDVSLYDLAVDNASLTFVTWEKHIRTFKYNPEQSFFDIVVPTVDTTRFGHLLKALTLAGKNTLLVGSTGVGKSVLVKSVILECGDKYVGKTQGFSAQTSARNLQDFFESCLDKRRKNLLGPPAGKTLIFFIDDVNMPQVETYGAQPPVELFRQVLDHGGFYDLDPKKLYVKYIADSTYIAACGPTLKMTPRLLRQFNLLHMPQLSEESMGRIFESILGGFLGNLNKDLCKLTSQLVQASVAVYNKVSSDLRPTPSKFHYTFNLRDPAKVIQGILTVGAKQVPDTNHLLKLWAHEMSRVFRDRLNEQSDCDWFDNLMCEKLKDTFQVDWKPEDVSDLVWVDFQGGQPADYHNIEEISDFKEQIEEALEMFNTGNSQRMDLVFFKDAVLHVARIYRILRQQRGNVMTVGVGGSGRQSMTKMASSMCDYKVKQIEIKKGYGMVDWHDDIRVILKEAGGKNQPTVFLFSSTQIINNGLLEDINNILNSGEVPNLFDVGEKEEIIGMVRPIAKANGIQDAKDLLWSYFITLCRQNLHIVLCMSPGGNDFRTQCRMFPSLVNCTTIDWFFPWPQDALLSVAQRFFAKIDVGEPEIKEACCRMCVKVHGSVEEKSRLFHEQLGRHNHTTPTSYLELINLYSGMLAKQTEVCQTKQQRLSGGVKKMGTINEMVAEMKIKLAELQPVLAKSVIETEELLTKVKGEQIIADEAKIQCKQDEEDCNEIAAEAGAIKADAQKDLDLALPAFHGALKALKSLSKDDINTVKSFPQPPEYVQKTLEAVCILLGEKTDWATAKKTMSRMSFMNELADYDKDNIAPQKIKKLRPYTKDENFNPEFIGNVSGAAKSLCMWVLAMITYDKVAKDVEPKRNALKAAEEKLNGAQTMLKEKQAQLKEVEDRVANLNANLQATLKKKEDLEKSKEMTVLRLERADKLVAGLGGEQKRWGETCVTLQGDLDNLVGNILLAAAAIAYAGPFTFEYRAELAEQWTTWCRGEGIKVDAEFSLKKCLGDPVKIRQWNTFGLPTDELSIQNGLFVEWGRRWPLMIDPQSQANRWIKAMEKSRKLRVVKLTQGDFLRTLENCIRVGQPVLMENVEESLDPSLEPLLLKQTYKKGGRLVLRLGDSDVDYVEDFKFYLTSKLPNPHYAPATQVKVTIVNFTVTQKGLENQLLAQVVALERPDLEEQAASLTMQINDGQNEVYNLEGTILKLLSEAGDDMLDDDVLINTLDNAKKTSNEISAQVKEAEATGKLIEETRELYRPAACRGSVLYFAVADMGKIDYMYQYSLQYFSKLFCFNIQNSEANADVGIRVETIIKVITVEIFLNICRGLFERDKILFASVIAFSVLRNSEQILPTEWSYFISGSGILDYAGLPEWTGGAWLFTKVWVELLTLAGRPGAEAFKGIDQSLKDDEAAWEEYGTCDSPHERDLPAGWSDKLSSFQVMLVLKIMRPEKMVFGVPNFVKKHLGGTFIESQPFDLSASYTQSDNATPIIFVLSSGADPTAYLMKLARDTGFYDKIKVISLGQGQGPKAEVLIETAIKDGESIKWVCLQNCHLAASWMSTLESMIEKISSVWDVHNDFRLFLTSMPTTSFPVTILQVGIKLTNEPPSGLRANIRGSYFDIEQEVFDSCTKQEEWKILLFAMCFFHAIVQERRKFGALGWNIRYDWNNSDRAVSITMLSNYLDEQPEVPWSTLRYVISETNYGGRVTDSWDQRCVNAMFARYYVPEILSGEMSLDPKGGYTAVKRNTLDEYRTYIDGCPSTETPDAFGLHPNAEITFQRNEAAKLMNNIVALQPRTAAAGGAKPEDTAIDLARSILAKVPPIMDMDEAHECVFAKDPTGAVNSLGLFLSMEIIRFNPLLSFMKKTLKELELSLQGLAVMTGELDSMFSAFLLGQVPPNWEKHCYISLKPLGGWVEDLFARVVMMDRWLHEGPPDMFWLAGFFFPQGFMTAVLQTHSRKFSIAIDTLAFNAEVQKEVINSELAPAAMAFEDGITMESATKPENGVKIFGMFMQGGRWDREKHAVGDSDPGILFTQMPIILLDPVVTDGKKINVFASPEGFYRCPMYKTSTRAGTLSTTGHSTNYVVALNLPSLHDAEHWVMCGVAMLTQLDD